MFTIDQVIQATDDVVTKIGGATKYVDRWRAMTGESSPWAVSSCKYLVDDRPACLVGVVMDHLGVDREILRQWDDSSDAVFHLVARGIDSTTYDEANDEEVEEVTAAIDITDDAVKFLRIAQREQDAGQTWAAAVQYAKQQWRTADFGDLY